MGIDLAGTPDHFKRCLPEQERKALGKHGWTQEEAEKRYEAGQEKELQEDVARWLEMAGVHFTRSRMDKRTTTPNGTADFICCVEGLYLAIECKCKGGILSPAQTLELKAIQSSKGRVIVAYDLKTVQKEVRNLQAEMRYVRETLYKQGWKMK
jgi:hypothetical protein